MEILLQLLLGSGRLYNYSGLIDCTTVDSSIANGDYVTIQQRIEGVSYINPLWNQNETDQLINKQIGVSYINP